MCELSARYIGAHSEVGTHESTRATVESAGALHRRRGVPGQRAALRNLLRPWRGLPHARAHTRGRSFRCRGARPPCLVQPRHLRLHAHARQRLAAARAANMSHWSSCERALATPAVLAVVFSALPPDTRLRCREVCTAWRRVLDDAALWTALDFRECELSEALLAAAAARSAGRLRLLTFGKVRQLWEPAGRPDAAVGQALLQVLRDNAASLRHFDASMLSAEGREPLKRLHCTQVAAIVAAAPELETLTVHIRSVNPATLLPLLQRKCVQPASLLLCQEHPGPQNWDTPRVRELAAAIARKGSTLHHLGLIRLPLDAATEELFDALVACPLLTRLYVSCADFPRDVLVGLARLLRENVLVELSLSARSLSPDLWELQAVAMEFAASLRACTRLTRLTFDNFGFLHARGTVGAEAAVLASLVGHLSLTRLMCP